MNGLNPRLGRWIGRWLGLALVCVSCSALADGWPTSAPEGQATSGLFITHPENATAATGDGISTTVASGGLATYFSYFVEVPVGLGSLTVEIFDPDLNQGAEGSAAALPHYDQPRTGGASVATYTLLDPSGAPIQTLNGSATLPAASHASWVPFTTVSGPTNGHWEVRVDAGVGGSVVNGYGIRASSGATQLRVYADAHLSVQNYGTSGVYVAHPYVTGYCQLRTKDFDADAATSGAIGAASSITIRSGAPTAISAVISGATMSANNAVWATNTTTAAWHSDVLVARPGIYTAEIRPRSTGATNEFQVGFYNPTAAGGTPVASGGSWANSWRTYLPSPTGAPVKPFLTQRIFHANNGSPNPPLVGQTGNYDVTIQMVNPTAYPITFSSSNTVISSIPGGQVLRANFATSVSQGVIVSQPGVGGSGLVTWNPGTVAPGATATISYRIAVTPTALGRILATGTPSVDGTTARYIDETGSTQARATYVWGPLCELAVTAGGPGVATPATLASVSSRRIGGGIEVELRTAVQVGVAYYELLEAPSARSTDWKVISGSAKAAPPDSLASESIRLEGVTQSDRFMVRSVDIDGSKMLHGPYQVGLAEGSDPESRAIPWQAIRSEYVDAQKLRAKSSAQGGSAAAIGAADLKVEQAGIARLRFEDLPTGFASSALSGIGLFDRGVSVPIRLFSNDDRFGPGDTLEFLADQPHNLYSKAKVYQLRIDQASPARISERKALPPIANRERLQVEITDKIARDSVYNFASPVPDPWHVERLLSTTAAPLSKNYTLQISPNRSSGDVYLAGAFVGGIDLPGHEIRISVNGTAVETLRFDGLNVGNFEVRVPPTAFVAGANTVTLMMPATNNIDIVWLERLSVRYQGARTATRGSAIFTPVSGDYSDLPSFDSSVGSAGLDVCEAANQQDICQNALVSELSGATARVYRRTLDGKVEALLGLSTAADGVSWAEPRTLGREIFVADESGLVPVTATISEHSAQLSAPAELLIVSHPQFVDAVQRLADRRRAQGLSVATVSTAAAYQRYSGGNVDPEAIDQLIAEAVNDHATRYVLLVGADSYDYQNQLGSGSISFLPSHYVRLHPVVNHAPTDGKYADVDGDQIADLAIGRFPVRTVAELNTAIAKIEAYEAEAGPATAPALFIADDRDPNGASFTATSELLRARFAPPTKTAYLDELSPMQVRKSLFNAARAGASMIHYFGHSSPSTWTSPSPGLITPAELSNGALANSVRPTVLVQWGCWNSYLAAPQTDSLGHSWFLSPGAAVAVIGATSLTDAQHDAELSYRLLHEWSKDGVRIGDAVLRAKQNMAIGNPKALDVLLGTTLFGDPSMPRRD